ncbi:carbohydrate ABC transporter permease [candidate division WOR-3 bacterium]|uniref:Carbohydrate ABC transporter permease n=1 Tax=candidate division WOR-3 bacterium TaxID=2052148 RepID=A0A660SGV3_UNCW3|nr:MAG: carbohydrate ABC transporter permease [candidate division WOR-3 bacterium]
MIERGSRRKALIYLAALMVALWVLVPILLIGLAAFSPKDEVYRWPKSIIPSHFSLETMEFFLRSYGVIPSLLNSIWVALLTLVLTLIIGAPAGYAVARFLFRGRESFRLGILLTRMFPTALLAIPLTTTFIRWGLYDTLFGVAFIHTAMALPFAVIIATGIFIGVPKELEEAAMVMGCSRLGAFMRVALPLALPGLAAVAMFTFVISWNEVFAAGILTVHNRTLPAHILTTLQASPLYFRFAGGFFMVIPALIFMFFIRRYLLHMWGATAER